MEYQIGTKVLGQWEIKEEIGQGTYGKVFVVEKNEYGVRAKSALKVLTIPASTSEVKMALSNGMDEQSVTAYFKSRVESIMRECAVMSSLKSCQNIVHFEDYTVQEHNPESKSFGWDILIRMELLTDLDNYMVQHPFYETDVVKMAKDILNALIFCKKSGIVHRDIKPANILVSETGVFKLGDFGESRTMDKTLGATKRGTDSYMAPEVYKNRPYGSNVDIYSLGIVMYKLMNKNRLPFYPPAGQVISYSDVENALKRRTDGEIPSAPSEASDGLAKIILKAISPSKDERYREPEDMLRDLIQIVKVDNQGFDQTILLFDQVPDQTVELLSHSLQKNDGQSNTNASFTRIDSHPEVNQEQSRPQPQVRHESQPQPRQQTRSKPQARQHPQANITSNTSGAGRSVIAIMTIIVMFILIGAMVLNRINYNRQKAVADAIYEKGLINIDENQKPVTEQAKELKENSKELERFLEEAKDEQKTEEDVLMDQWSNAISTFASYIDQNSVDYYNQGFDQTIEMLGEVIKNGAETKSSTYNDDFGASYMVELSNRDSNFSVSLGERTDGRRWINWTVWSDVIVDDVSVIDEVFTDKIHFGMTAYEVLEKLNITSEMMELTRHGKNFVADDRRVSIQRSMENVINPYISIVDSKQGKLELKFQDNLLSHVMYERY